MLKGIIEVKESMESEAIKTIMNESDKIRIRKNLKPLCIINNEKVLVSKKNNLYILSIEEDRLDKVSTIRVSWWRNVSSLSRLLTRRFGLLPRLAIPVDENEVLISHLDSIYLMDINKTTITKVHTYERDKGLALSFSQVNGEIYYGEYYFNPLKKNVSIFKYNKCEKKFLKVFTFADGMLNHIHQILEDKYRKRIWIFAGDSNNSAAIYYTDDEFNTVSVFLSGAQKYRACYAVAVEDGIVYATDTPSEQNNIRKIIIENDKIYEENICEITGSCISGIQYQDWIIWSTTVENAAYENSSFLNYISYKRGKGIKSWYCEIIGYNKKTFQCKTFYRFKKDVFPMLLFGFGKVNFPYSERPCSKLMGFGESLKRIDGHMIFLDPQ